MEYTLMPPTDNLSLKTTWRHSATTLCRN